MSPPRPSIPVALVAALALFAVVPATAGAKGKKKKPKAVPVTVVQSTGSTSTDNQKLSLTASCPPGQLAVGGGFSSATAYNGSTLSDMNLVYASRRTAPGSWTVDAAREDTSTAGPALSLTASVDCRSKSLGKKKKKGKKKKVLSISEATATSVPVGLNAATSASASCTGVPAIGGGFTSSPVPDLSAANAFPFLWANSRSGPGTWTTSFTNRGSVPRTITSQVLCAKGLKLSEGSGLASLPPGGPGNNPLATATSAACAKGSSQLGGGFSFAQTNITAGPVTLLIESAPAGGQWKVSAASLVAPGSVPLTASGYCG